MHVGIPVVDMHCMKSRSGFILSETLNFGNFCGKENGAHPLKERTGALLCLFSLSTCSCRLLSAYLLPAVGRFGLCCTQAV